MFADVVTVNELVNKHRPLDLRRAPYFEVATNTTLIAVCVSTVSTFDPEDEVREVAKVGVAKLSLDDLHGEGLLAPGPNGIYWTKEIKTNIYILENCRCRDEIGETLRGYSTQVISDLARLVKTGFNTAGQTIIISDNLRNTELRLAESSGAAWDTV